MIQLGEFELFVLSDGLFRLDGGAMFGVVPKVLWEKAEPPDAKNRILMGLNCLLVKTPEENILIETGVGDKIDPKSREIHGVERPVTLMQSLKEVGMNPEDIDKVVLTHLHFDHCGNNTFIDNNGELRPTFPRAEYFVQKLEWEDAQNPDIRSKTSYFMDNISPVEKVGQLRLVSGDQQIAPGVDLILTPGHTRGHQIVKLESQGKIACFTGDLIPMSSHIRVPYVMSYDLFPLATMKSKEKILKQVVEENWLLFFGHSPKVKAGYVREVEGKLKVEKVEV